MSRACNKEQGKVPNLGVVTTITTVGLHYLATDKYPKYPITTVGLHYLATDKYPTETFKKTRRDFVD